jgi:hypothetical protein
MAFRILKVKSQVVVQKPVLSLQKADLDDIKIQAEITILDKGNLSTIGDGVSNEGNLEELPEIATDFFRPGDDDLGITKEPNEPDSSKPDVDSYTEDKFDEFLAAVLISIDQVKSKQELLLVKLEMLMGNLSGERTQILYWVHNRLKYDVNDE